MNIEQLAANTIRALSMDAVQKANSGHPGAPLGMADMAVVLWSKFLRVDPNDPTWENRDRFVLSNGHASMMLYSILHLTGFDYTIEDIKSFRQWGSATPGHPERDVARGIETTTGPLGQGFATGVGMAIAEAKLNERFGAELIDHRVYGFVGDGDMQEGVASEAASLAGHLGLGKLIYLHDANEITLVGPRSWSDDEDTIKRFDAYGWQTLAVDGHDQAAIAEALTEAVADQERPSMITCRTHIAFGSPHKQDSASAHGSPLGEEEIALTKEALGWEYGPFEVPSEVYEFFAEALADRHREAGEWLGRLETRLASDPELATEWHTHFAPEAISIPVPEYEAGAKAATRAVSGAIINSVAAARPDLIGGSADLASSNNSLINSSGDFTASDRSGRNIRFGIREHAMGAVVNGINIHGGMRAFGATFLTFSDYMRGAVRLGALIGAPSIWVFTHDSIFVGEDGPTHQPVEHVAALRAIPNLWVVRPGNAAEVAGAWELALNRRQAPTALVLSRQGLPAGGTDSVPVAKGAYVAREGSDAVLVATGSELATALDAAEILDAEGKSIRVISMPCREAFEAQDAAYKAGLFGEDLPIASVEAGITFGWGDIVGKDGLSVGIDRFGASAPGPVVAEKLGITPDQVAAKVSAWLD